MHRSEKIKVTVVTGYLGAGKTTLINRLLAHSQGISYAVVENEFGAVSIDGRLLRGLNASYLFELKDGCICCSISDEYEQVLIELATGNPNIRHLLIETTGIADPGEVIRPFLQNKEITRLYEFCGAVGLADASRFEFTTQQPVAVRQLASASLIVVAKSEKCSVQQLETLGTWLKMINPFARIANYHELESEEITDDHWKSHSRKLVFPKFSVSGSIHTNITSRTYHFSYPLDRERFEDWLSYQLDINRNFVHRAKGILYFKQEPFEYYLQGVGASYEIIEGNIAGFTGESVVVFIGDLDSAVITNFETASDAE